MATFPLATLAPTVTAFGISIPSYPDIYQSLQTSFLSIYGSDSYIDPDSQDGQLLAIMAQAIADSNDAAVAIYNSFSPATSQGAALSSMVKINGLARLVASASQVIVTLTGQVGSTITNGQVGDTNGHFWTLPASVVIPPAGFISVTATCTEEGAIEALVGTVTKIMTPTLGWQSVTNPSAASLGAPVETDAALRARQAISTANPALTVLPSIVGGVSALTGVTQIKAYENDTNITDANGLPPHSISLVVLGGVASQIAQVISDKKSLGVSTYGSTSVNVTDPVGVNRTIKFYVPTIKTITVAISIHPLTAGYTSAIGQAVINSIIAYINSLLIGDDVERAKLYLPAQLYGGADSLTYSVTSLQIAVSPGAVGTSDLTIGFNEKAQTATANVTLTLV